MSRYGLHILKSEFKPELALRLVSVSSHKADAGRALHVGAVDKTVSGHFKVVSSVILYFVAAVCRLYFKMKT